MKLSIIVPVYNVEKHLRRCLDSIMVEMCDEYELILVDDGSTDGSGAMCDDFASEHAAMNIIVLHQPNGGLSAARNRGVDVARGEYVTFVDSDDYIDACTFDTNMAYLRSHPEVDMLEYPVEVHAESTEVYMLTFPDEIQQANLFADWIRREGYLHCYACNKIYRKHLWHSLRFPVGRYFEDLAVMPHVIKQCRVIYYSGRGCYRYIKHEGTITNRHSYNKQRLLYLGTHRLYLEVKGDMTLYAESLRLWMHAFNHLVDMGRCKDMDEADYRRMIDEAEQSLPPYIPLLKEAVRSFRFKLIPLPMLGFRNYLRCYVALKPKI